MSTDTQVSKVFIAFQDNEDSRPIVEAILADNPDAEPVYSPGLIKIDCPHKLIVRRESIEEITGQPFNLQQIQLSLVTLSGNVDEDDDEFSLEWRA